MTSPEWKARPTVYDGIQMRSRLEAKIAAELDALGADWEYEPRAYASGGGQYLPDFCVTNAEVIGDDWQCSESYVFVEVRPTAEKAMATLERDTAIMRASHPDPLITLGFFDHMPLTGYVWGDAGRDAAVLMRRITAENRKQPTLFVGQVAVAYGLGYFAGRDSMQPPYRQPSSAVTEVDGVMMNEVQAARHRGRRTFT